MLAILIFLSSQEHLAMMQRILGPIPAKMAERSNLKYFSKVVSSVYNIYNNGICTSSFSKGKLRWDEESTGGRHVRRKCKPLMRYIPREVRRVVTCPGAVSSLVIMLPGARRRGLGRNVPLGRPDAPLRAFQGKFAPSVNSSTIVRV